MDGVLTEFRHTVRRLRGAIIGWGLGLALYGLAMGLIYDTIQGISGLGEMLAQYPPELMAFFGDITSLATATSYFDIYYSSYMPIIVGIFAAGAGAGLLAGDEERGTLDLTLAQPIGRSGLVLGRWLALVVAIGLILLLGYLGWLVTLPFSSMDVSAVDLLRPFLPLWALLALFAALALLLSMVLPSARMASMVAGGLLVANFLLAGLANLNEDLRGVMDVTPFAFFQGGDAIDGLKWGWLLGLTVAAWVLVVGAWLLFLRRDIRVGGERSWSGWRRARPRSAGANQ